MQASPTNPLPERRRFPLGFWAGVVSAALIISIVGFYLRATYLVRRIAEHEVAPDRIGSNAPFITTPDPIVERMVEVAELSSEDVVYDLGCGDGRIVITAALKSGCRGVGFDIDPERVAQARENVKKNGVEHLVEIREQDVFTVDMREADVAMFYLLPWMIKKMIPQFQQMEPGSRLVSHDFAFGDIKYIPPDETVAVEQIIKTGDHKRVDTHFVHRWSVPLKVPPDRTTP